MDLEVEPPIKWKKLCENPENKKQKVCFQQEMGVKYRERKIPRSCKRIWNIGSWLDLVFERSKDI